ncbi:hypothetical protein SMAC4_13277 [Sordaria macrospora]|nr:hypothetical protein SMAC4_13277 [Sordaria macrospora]
MELREYGQSDRVIATIRSLMLLVLNTYYLVEAAAVRREIR